MGECRVKDFSVFDDIVQQVTKARCSYSKLHGGFGEEMRIEEFDKKAKREIRLDYEQLCILYDCLNAYYGKHLEVMGKMHQEYLDKKYKEFVENGGLNKLAEVVGKLCEKAGDGNDKDNMG